MEEELLDWYKLPSEKLTLQVLWARRSQIEKEMDTLKIEQEAIQQCIDKRLRKMSLAYNYGNNEKT